jgi:4-carboxymuconolactone decarboxylase
MSKKKRAANPYDERMRRGTKLLKRMGREGLLDDQKSTYPALYDLAVGHLFGDIWTRPHLTLRDRQLITLAANVALARTTGNHSHYHSALHIGITKEEILELIIQVGHYAGWPTIGLATRQLNKVLAADAARTKKNKPNNMKELAAAWERNT